MIRQFQFTHQKNFYIRVLQWLFLQSVKPIIMQKLLIAAATLLMLSFVSCKSSTTTPKTFCDTVCLTDTIKFTGNHEKTPTVCITVRSGIDVLVASFCIERDYLLLHRDRDFDAFADLRGLRVWRH